MRPHSCGGAGTTFSRAAVLATDFGGCAARFALACLQSDWMISLCAAHYEVAPLRQYGCMCGQLSDTDSRTNSRLSPVLRFGGGDECTFTHMQEFRASKRTWRQRGEWVVALSQRLAIVHATPIAALGNASGRSSAVKWRDLVRPAWKRKFHPRLQFGNGSACQERFRQRTRAYWYMHMH